MAHNGSVVLQKVHLFFLNKKYIAIYCLCCKAPKYLIIEQICKYNRGKFAILLISDIENSYHLDVYDNFFNQL